MAVIIEFCSFERLSANKWYSYSDDGLNRILGKSQSAEEINLFLDVVKKVLVQLLFVLIGTFIDCLEVMLLPGYQLVLDFQTVYQVLYFLPSRVLGQADLAQFFLGLRNFGNLHSWCHRFLFR